MLNEAVEVLKKHPTIRIEVVGHQWWWEYIYESYDGRPLNFITANELHIPASDDTTTRPVYLTLKSADVCHSFWVPRLGGKLDAIPGRTNVLRLQADNPGVYRGQCAEFCGMHHATMQFTVEAHAPDDFTLWLEAQQND